MKRKLIFLLSLIFIFLFLAFIPNVFKSPLYATNACTGGEINRDDRVLTVVLDNDDPTLFSEGSFVASVTGQGPKNEGTYVVYVRATDNTTLADKEDEVWRSNTFKLNDGQRKLITVRLSNFDPNAIAGDEYNIRALKFGNIGRCGQASFKIKAEPPPPPEETTDNQCALVFTNNSSDSTVTIDQGRKVSFNKIGNGLAVFGNNFTLKQGPIGLAMFPPNSWPYEVTFPNIGSFPIKLYHIESGPPEIKHLCISGPRSGTLVVEVAGAGDDVDPIPVPGLAPGSSKPVNEVASGFASTFLSFGIGIAGGIAFLLMVFGAYRLIFAGGNPDAMQQGKEIITAAIAGLLVIIFAVFILRFLGFTILGLGF